jgi:hypothetical protein
MTAAIHALNQSSSYSKDEHLPDESFDDGRFKSGFLKSLNKEVSDLKDSWCVKLA